MDEEFEIDPTLASLPGRKVAVTAAPDEGLAQDWLALQGISPDVFLVRKGYGLNDSAVWSARIVGKASSVGLRRTRQWVTYELGECLWAGPNADLRKSSTLSNGRETKRFRGVIEDFDLTLSDALSRLRVYLERFRSDAKRELVMLEKNIEKLVAETDRHRAYVAQLEAFDPDTVVATTTQS